MIISPRHWNHLVRITTSKCPMAASDRYCKVDFSRRTWVYSLTVNSLRAVMRAGRYSDISRVNVEHIPKVTLTSGPSVAEHSNLLFPNTLASTKARLSACSAKLSPEYRLRLFHHPQSYDCPHHGRVATFTRGDQACLHHK
jgi:hypothetical protein